MLFHLLQIAVDLETKKYLWLRWDDVETDLSGKAMGTFPDTAAFPYLELFVEADTVDTQGCAVYIDDVVAVRNLP